MAAGELSSGTTFLVNSAKKYFEVTFQGPQIHLESPVDSTLNWIPALHFKLNDHLTVIAEASETPYPLIFSLRRQDVIRLQQPVAIYCICPEESYLHDQSASKRLIADGYGLITIASDGSAQKRASCIPLIQQITDEEFLADIRNLPRKFRTRLAEAFDRYKFNAPSGVADIAEVFEGLVLKAGRDGVKRTWLPAWEVRPGAPARTLQAMTASPQFQNTRAAIGAAEAFISMYRNTSHHFPKNAKQAATKYRDCRHGFLEGLKKLVFFRDAVKSIGLTGGL